MLLSHKKIWCGSQVIAGGKPEDWATITDSVIGMNQQSDGSDMPWLDQMHKKHFLQLHGKWTLNLNS